MERRKAIKNIGLSLGTVVATPSILSLLQSCQSEAAAPWKPVFYTEDQGLFVRNLVDALLPPAGDLPGAIDVNVHVFIDQYMKEVTSVDDKGPHRKTVELVMNELLKLENATEIGNVDDTTYTKFLQENLTKSKEEHDKMMAQIYAHLSENNGSVLGLDTKLVVYQLLHQMRGFAVWAYQRSEQIGENVLAYKSIPGEQRGCVDLEEATGGKAWALTFT